MRIAQVAPLYESVPPKRYGGTERVVSYLTEALVELGHDVTLFASGDSVTSAELVPCCDRSLRLDPGCKDMFAHHFLLLEKVCQRLDEFDIVHYHIDYLHFPLSRRCETPQVTTLHGRLDLPDLAPLYREFTDMPVISISDAQRGPLPWARWVGTVYHGLPDLYTLHESPEEYVAFVGRISPEKGLERAIAAARLAGIEFRIAAKVDRVDRDYFESEIEPLLREPGVEYLGEIDDAAKNEFLGGALAMLFLIDWPEPFGLAMIEAMACGTPVIARPCGSVPEVVDDGVTGIMVDTVEEAAAAIQRCGEFDRRGCRQRFEERFTADRMARDYMELYRALARPHLADVHEIVKSEVA